MSEYIIVGDTDEFKDCLIYTCGTKKRAEEVLERMMNNPDEEDNRMIQKHHNIRIEEVPDNECWWNDPFLAN